MPDLINLVQIWELIIWLALNYAIPRYNIYKLGKCKQVDGGQTVGGKLEISYHCPDSTVDAHTNTGFRLTLLISFEEYCRKQLLFAL